MKKETTRKNQNIRKETNNTGKKKEKPHYADNGSWKGADHV